MALAPTGILPQLSDSLPRLARSFFQADLAVRQAMKQHELTQGFMAKLKKQKDKRRVQAEAGSASRL